MTYSPKNDIKAIFEYLKKLGIKSVHLEPLFPYGRNYDKIVFGSSKQADVYAPTAIELSKKFLEAMSWANKFNIKIFNSHLANLTRNIGYFCESSHARSMMVTHDGFLTGCLEVVDSNDRDFKTFGYGKFSKKESTFKLNKQKIVKLSKRNVHNISSCNTCFARYVCAGGCAVKALRDTGDYMQKNISYCSFNKILIPALIKRISLLTGI